MRPDTGAATRTARAAARTQATRTQATRTQATRTQAARTREAVAAPAAGAGDIAARARRAAAEWAPTLGRILLGLVLAWFGYHELVAPQLWTGYVPGVPATSGIAVALVLAHGWVLFMLAVAIVAGVALRLAAAIAALLVLQIVITLTVSGGLTDLTLRDVGVLGLALALTGDSRQRAVLAR